jgi:DNA-binding response OmpR family regulator
LRRTYRILLIEGHLPDAVLIERALAAEDVQLRVVYGESQARQQLLREPPFEGLRTPDLILLDAELPSGESSSLLSFLRSDAALRRIPVLLLRSNDRSWSSLPMTYAMYTSGQISQPIGFAAVQELVRDIRRHRAPTPWIDEALEA